MDRWGIPPVADVLDHDGNVVTDASVASTMASNGASPGLEEPMPSMDEPATNDRSEDVSMFGDAEAGGTSDDTVDFGGEAFFSADATDAPTDFSIDTGNGGGRPSKIKFADDPGSGATAGYPTDRGSRRLGRGGRDRGNGSMATIVGIIAGPFLASGLVFAILAPLGKLPNLGFWPFDGSFQSSAAPTRTVAAPVRSERVRSERVREPVETAADLVVSPSDDSAAAPIDRLTSVSPTPLDEPETEIVELRPTEGLASEMDVSLVAPIDPEPTALADGRSPVVDADTMPEGTAASGRENSLRDVAESAEGFESPTDDDRIAGYIRDVEGLADVDVTTRGGKVEVATLFTKLSRFADTVPSPTAALEALAEAVDRSPRRNLMAQMTAEYPGARRGEAGLLVIGRFDPTTGRIDGAGDFEVLWEPPAGSAPPAGRVIAWGRLDRTEDPPRLTAAAVYPQP